MRDEEIYLTYYDIMLYHVYRGTYMLDITLLEKYITEEKRKGFYFYL